MRRTTIDRPNGSAPRKRLHDLADSWPEAKTLGLIQHILLIGYGDALRFPCRKTRAANACGNNHLLPVELQLPDSFVIDEIECLVLYDRSAKRHPVLAHPEWGDFGIAVDVEIKETAGVEIRISEITEGAAVEIVRAGLGFGVDLAA